jgi:hypothetical protein
MPPPSPPYAGRRPCRRLQAAAARLCTPQGDVRSCTTQDIAAHRTSPPEGGAARLCTLQGDVRRRTPQDIAALRRKSPPSAGHHRLPQAIAILGMLSFNFLVCFLSISDIAVLKFDEEISYFVLKKTNFLSFCK